LTFKNPKTNKFIASDKMKANASASSFRREVKGFYWSTLRSDILVTREDLDADGNNIKTSNKTLKTYKYTIQLMKLISGESSTQIIVGKLGTKSSISVKLPS
jgi:hypothetical protein